MKLVVEFETSISDPDLFLRWLKEAIASEGLEDQMEILQVEKGASEED